MSSLGSLVPEGPWCVFYATRHQIYAHTNMHSTTRGHPGDRHTHVNIYLQHMLFSHSSYLSYIKWLDEFTNVKNFLSTKSFLFKNYSLIKVIYLLIRCYKIEIDGNGVHTHTHTHTHTPNTKHLRKIALERVS